MSQDFNTLLLYGLALGGSSILLLFYTIKKVRERNQEYLKQRKRRRKNRRKGKK